MTDQSNDTPSRDGDVYDKLFERILANEGDLGARDQIARPSQFTPLLCSNCFADYAPKEGSTYVLFLRPARRSTLPNNYELHAEGIFEIDGDRVIPLFRDAINVFGGTIDRDVNAFTARIRNAVHIR